jgi:hypothetical protein
MQNLAPGSFVVPQVAQFTVDLWGVTDEAQLYRARGEIPSPKRSWRAHPLCEIVAPANIIGSEIRRGH